MNLKYCLLIICNILVINCGDQNGILTQKQNTNNSKIKNTKNASDSTYSHHDEKDDIPNSFCTKKILNDLEFSYTEINKIVNYINQNTYQQYIKHEQTKELLMKVLEDTEKTINHYNMQKEKLDKYFYKQQTDSQHCYQSSVTKEDLVKILKTICKYLEEIIFFLKNKENILLKKDIYKIENIKDNLITVAKNFTIFYTKNKNSQISINDPLDYLHNFKKNNPKIDIKNFSHILNEILHGCFQYSIPESIQNDLEDKGYGKFWFCNNCYYMYNVNEKCDYCQILMTNSDKISFENLRKNFYQKFEDLKWKCKECSSLNFNDSVCYICKNLKINNNRDNISLETIPEVNTVIAEIGQKHKNEWKCKNCNTINTSTKCQKCNVSKPTRETSYYSFITKDNHNNKNTKNSKIELKENDTNIKQKTKLIKQKRINEYTICKHCSANLKLKNQKKHLKICPKKNSLNKINEIDTNIINVKNDESNLCTKCNENMCDQDFELCNLCMLDALKYSFKDSDNDKILNETKDENISKKKKKRKKKKKKLKKNKVTENNKFKKKPKSQPVKLVSTKIQQPKKENLKSYVKDKPKSKKDKLINDPNLAFYAFTYFYSETVMKKYCLAIKNLNHIDFNSYFISYEEAFNNLYKLISENLIPTSLNSKNEVIKNLIMKLYYVILNMDNFLNKCVSVNYRYLPFILYHYEKLYKISYNKFNPLAKKLNIGLCFRKLVKESLILKDLHIYYFQTSYNSNNIYMMYRSKIKKLKETTNEFKKINLISNFASKKNVFTISDIKLLTSGISSITNNFKKYIQLLTMKNRWEKHKANYIGLKSIYTIIHQLVPEIFSFLVQNFNPKNKNKKRFTTLITELKDSYDNFETTFSKYLILKNSKVITLYNKALLDIKKKDETFKICQKRQSPINKKTKLLKSNHEYEFDLLTKNSNYNPNCFASLKSIRCISESYVLIKKLQIEYIIIRKIREKQEFDLKSNILLNIFQEKNQYNFFKQVLEKKDLSSDTLNYYYMEAMYYLLNKCDYINHKDKFNNKGILEIINYISNYLNIKKGRFVYIKQCLLKYDGYEKIKKKKYINIDGFFFSLFKYRLLKKEKNKKNYLSNKYKYIGHFISDFKSVGLPTLIEEHNFSHIISTEILKYIYIVIYILYYDIYSSNIKSNQDLESKNKTLSELKSLLKIFPEQKYGTLLNNSNELLEFCQNKLKNIR